MRIDIDEGRRPVNTEARISLPNPAELVEAGEQRNTAMA